MKFLTGNSGWYSKQTLAAKKFKCGYCGNKVSSERGYKIGEHSDGSGQHKGGIYLCPECDGPIFFTLDNVQIPGAAVGNEISYLPVDLEKIYNEARKCISQNCFTAAVLLCRKIIMNISVEQGAEEGLNFYNYVEYLSEKGYVPPNGEKWLHHVRKKGNIATHEIKDMNFEDARDLLVFIEMLLRFIYEFPNSIED